MDLTHRQQNQNTVPQNKKTQDTRCLPAGLGFSVGPPCIAPQLGLSPSPSVATVRVQEASQKDRGQSIEKLAPLQAVEQNECHIRTRQKTTD